MNKAASDEIIWHCKHYTGRGVMKFYENGEALCKDMNISLSTLEAGGSLDVILVAEMADFKFDI